MSCKPVIQVDGLAKCYQIYQQPYQRLLQMFLRGRKKLYREFWAVQPLSFSVEPGQTLGIVGRNGSGKSTLLQMICGTLTPSCGRLTVQGRIAALLELGSGFNPEFTGRENVFLNASVLGLSRQETEACFADIVAFADIGAFLDQPTKTYSSGMMVRLAFAVAVHTQPDVFIVDEALAVGDELFQRKCFAKIEQLKQQGTTILFVSHSGSMIIELCDRAILLDAGELLMEGVPKAVIAQYQKLIFAPQDKAPALRARLKQALQEPVAKDLSAATEMSQPESEIAQREDFDPHLVSSSQVAYESQGVSISEPQILNLQGRRVNHLVSGERYRYCYQVQVDQPVRGLVFGMMIKTLSGVDLGGASSQLSQRHPGLDLDTGQSIMACIEFDCRLAPGVYCMNAGVLGAAGGEPTYLARLLDAVMFRVLPEDERYATGWIDFACQPSFELIEHKESMRDE